MQAFITSLGAFLPGDACDNERAAQVLGNVGKQTRARDMILARNGIKSRHYAIDPATRQMTHTNAQLAAEAVRRMDAEAHIDWERLDILASGTSSPDQVIPGHAAMVHGELGSPMCEVLSAAGVCCSSIAALKFAFNGLLAGTARNAVVTGSELPSAIFRSARFGANPEELPSLDFEQEFLRWMLSDGAGAVLLETKPRPGKLNLQIDWIELISCAGQLPTCMYGGAVKRPDGSLRSWHQEENPEELVSRGYFNLTQDLKVLMANMIPVAFKQTLQRTLRRRELTADRIDWMLPHISSYLFEQPIYDTLKECVLEIPMEKWFTNLAYKGNTGSASMFIILEELLASGRVKPGDRIVCAIPERGRFSFGYMHLTAVAG